MQETDKAAPLHLLATTVEVVAFRRGDSMPATVVVMHCSRLPGVRLFLCYENDRWLAVNKTTGGTLFQISFVGTEGKNSISLKNKLYRYRVFCQRFKN